MRKRILGLFFAFVLALSMTVPALAKETFYPVSVEEYTAGDFDELRINKVYHLSLSDDPSGIPTDDFVRNGRHYYLLDLIRKDEVGVDTQPYTKTVTLPSTTNNMESVLQSLEAEMEVETEEGYSGVLKLDHTSVHVTVDGYKSSTKNHSATRTFPNPSDADLSLLPKTVTEGGRTLSLATVQWSSSYGDDGEGGASVRYSATASYTGTSTTRYATGYTITANYTGEVAKTGCEIVTYTAIFGSTEATPSEIASAKAEKRDVVPEVEAEMEPEPEPEPAAEQEQQEPEQEPAVDMSRPTPITAEGMLIALGCMVLVSIPTAIVMWIIFKIVERREKNHEK